MPSVLYLVTEPWYFANHRLDHARALLDAGFDVHVATRAGRRLDELVRVGCVVHEVELARGGGSVATWWTEARRVRQIVRTVSPDVVHAVALKPVALALTLIPGWRRPALLLSVNGLGLSATQRGRQMRLISAVIRVASRVPRVALLFQTEADRRALLGERAVGTVIPGVGVDTDRFCPGDRGPRPPTRVAYLGRAVVSKGLEEVAAARELTPSDDVRIELYCTIDASSPGALDDAALDRIRSSPGVTLHPATDDPAAVLATAHAAILPSVAGEGVSKFVLEALACGTPVLLSRESGSGEVIDAGVTGLVFRAGDPASINATLAELAGWDAARWAEASAACRETALRHYSLDVILPRIVGLHRQLVDRAAS